MRSLEQCVSQLIDWPGCRKCNCSVSLLWALEKNFPYYSFIRKTPNQKSPSKNFASMKMMPGQAEWRGEMVIQSDYQAGLQTHSSKSTNTFSKMVENTIFCPQMISNKGALSFPHLSRIHHINSSQRYPLWLKQDLRGLGFKRLANKKLAEELLKRIPEPWSAGKLHIWGGGGRKILKRLSTS